MNAQVFTNNDSIIVRVLNSEYTNEDRENFRDCGWRTLSESFKDEDDNICTILSKGLAKYFLTKEDYDAIWENFDADNYGWDLDAMSQEEIDGYHEVEGTLKCGLYYKLDFELMSEWEDRKNGASFNGDYETFHELLRMGMTRYHFEVEGGEIPCDFNPREFLTRMGVPEKVIA